MELTKETLRQWWLTTTGETHFTNVLGGLWKREPVEKLATTYNQIKNWTHDLAQEKVIVKAGGKRDGIYRLVDKAEEEILWWLGDDIDDSQANLLMPFGLHKAVYISRPALVIVSGDTNAGKTALVLNILNLNIEKYKDNALLLVTEGQDLLRGRFKNIHPPIPTPPGFKTFRKTRNFEDDILPDGLTIVDWLRPPNAEAVMSIGGKLEAIFSKLKTGIAVVAIQKPKGDRSEGFGGVITQWDSNLYMSIHGNGYTDSYLKLAKIKKPLIFDKNLYNLKIKFRIEKGIRLIELEKVYE